MITATFGFKLRANDDGTRFSTPAERVMRTVDAELLRVTFRSDEGCCTASFDRFRFVDGFLKRDATARLLILVRESLLSDDEISLI